MLKMEILTIILVKLTVTVIVTVTSVIYSNNKKLALLYKCFPLIVTNTEFVLMKSL